MFSAQLFPISLKLPGFPGQGGKLGGTDIVVALSVVLVSTNLSSILKSEVLLVEKEVLLTTLPVPRIAPEATDVSWSPTL